MRGWNKLWGVGAAMALSGCTYVVKDTAVVCDVPAGAAPVRVALPATDAQPAREVVLDLGYWLVETPPAQDGNVVWLAVSARNEGRRRYQTRPAVLHDTSDWTDGAAPVPLWYSSSAARLVREDGQPIAADPGLYRGFGAGMSARERRPVRFEVRELDLNSDAIHGPRPTGDLSQAIMIRFDVPPPAPDARWALSPGQLRVGDSGVVVDFPARALCLRKGHRGKVHWSMLP